MLLLVQAALSPLEGDVAGKAGIDRWSSSAFKGAGTETRATFRQMKFRTTDGFGAMHFKYSAVGPLSAV